MYTGVEKYVKNIRWAKPIFWGEMW